MSQSTIDAMEKSTTPYHEKQSLLNQLCLIHAINMLLGGRHVDKRNLDEVCETLSPDSPWWNPHRSALGLGNYDVNVAMYVLQDFGYDASFFDSRKSAKEISLENDCAGLLLNVKGTRFLPGSRHWISYRQVEGSWYQLDCKAEGPVEVDNIIEEMRAHLVSKDHILIVRKKQSNA
jgi:hypothetical protein